MAYNSQTEIDYAITSATRTGLFTDSGSYVSAAFSQELDRASAYLNAALSTAGYPVPVDIAALVIANVDSANLIKSLEVAVFVKATFPRKGIKIPQTYLDTLNVLPGIIDGSVPIPGLSVTSSTAVGGVLWTASTASDEGAPVFSRVNSTGSDPLSGM